MTPHEVTAQWWDHATLWNADDPTLDLAGHTTDGGRVFGITRTRYAECDHYGCKPVAVIQPEDREQVERLHSCLHMNFGTVEGITYALRAFIAPPTPTKPDEPTGLGAVVEDADGYQWVRFADKWVRDNAWAGEGDYADIAAMRILSDGVQP